MTTTINAGNGPCVLINVFNVKPENQQLLLDYLAEITEDFMQNQPGFISANFHKSLDGVRVTNYAQWQSPTHVQAMLQDPATNAHLERCRELAESNEAHLYSVESSFSKQP